MYDFTLTQSKIKLILLLLYIHMVLHYSDHWFNLGGKTLTSILISTLEVTNYSLDNCTFTNSLNLFKL